MPLKDKIMFDLEEFMKFISFLYIENDYYWKDGRLVDKDGNLIIEGKVERGFGNMSRLEWYENQYNATDKFLDKIYEDLHLIPCNVGLQFRVSEVINEYKEKNERLKEDVERLKRKIENG